MISKLSSNRIREREREREREGEKERKTMNPGFPILELKYELHSLVNSGQQKKTKLLELEK